MKALNRFSIFTSVATLFLIIAGASVTSTGSGLAVPDWPLSFGQFFPRMQGGVFFEHGHRMIAGTVGIFTAIVMVWLWIWERRKWVCWLGTAAFAMVLLQALLGGLTVLYGLPQKISIAHAVLAQTFFCFTVSLALFTSSYWRGRKWQNERMAVLTSAPDSFLRHLRRLWFLSVLATCLIFIQLILGAFSRHGMGEKFLFLHLFVGLAIPFLVGKIFLMNWRDRSKILFSNFSLSLMVFTIIQIALGIFSGLPKFGFGPFWLSSLFPWLITLHVGIGALLLGNSLLLTLMSFRFFVWARAFQARSRSLIRNEGSSLVGVADDFQNPCPHSLSGNIFPATNV